MIVRIYWTDQYLRQQQGFRVGTYGIIGRLAKQFAVSPNTIKKIVGMRDDKRRDRFPSVSVSKIRSGVRARIARKNGETKAPSR